MTTAELAERLDGYNQAYILRQAKRYLNEGEHYRSAGRRNYLFTIDAVKILSEKLDIVLE